MVTFKNNQILNLSMDSKIIFLGTAGHDAVGKQAAASGGIVIQTEKHQIHIDPGPCTLIRALQTKINLKETDILLVSHNHLSHCNDMNLVIQKMTNYHQEKRGTLITTKEVLPMIIQNNLKEVVALEPGKTHEVDTIRIRALKAIHSAETIGFKIFTPKFVVVYSADTSYSSDLIEEYKGADILILNVLGDEKTKYNLNTDDAVKIINKVDPKLTIITHFNNDTLSKDPLYRAREMQKATNHQIIAATDGLEIEPISYAATSNQKTLYLY